MIKLRHFFSYQFLLVISALVLFLAACEGDEGPRGPQGSKGEMGNSFTIIVPYDTTDIQAAIDMLPDAGGTVYIKAGTYLLDEEIHINRSNITLTGEMGTLLRLNEEVNQPVILIGSDSETPDSSELIFNIRVERLEIDGNMTVQSYETDPDRPWIRNNGIDVRMVKDLYVSEVDVYHARSGGIVVSWDSRIVIIDKSSFHHNFFDGIALYASEDIQVQNFFCYDNDAAGLSLDNDLKNVIFSTGSIKDNGDVGIFARHSKDLKFQGLVIANNQSHGCFLSHTSLGTGTGVTRLTFNSCSFTDNEGYGFWLASPLTESQMISIQGSVFSGNILGSIELIPESNLYQTGNVFQ